MNYSPCFFSVCFAALFPTFQTKKNFFIHDFPCQKSPSPSSFSPFLLHFWVIHLSSPLSLFKKPPPLKTIYLKTLWPEWRNSLVNHVIYHRFSRENFTTSTTLFYHRIVSHPSTFKSTVEPIKTQLLFITIIDVCVYIIIIEINYRYN